MECLMWDVCNEEFRTARNADNDDQSGKTRPL